MSPLLSWFFLLFQYNYLLPTLHVASCWVIVRNICYRELPLVTYQVSSWRMFSATEVAPRFYWIERDCLFSSTPNFTCLLPFLLIPSCCFNLSHFMGAISIEKSETRVEAYSSGIRVVEHVAISWTPASILCVWCFNENKNYSHYFLICTKSSLTSKFHMDIPFDSFFIAYLW